MTELTFLNYVSILVRNLNYHRKCREQKGNFLTILVLIFRNFTTSWLQRSDSPQVKRNVISSIENLVYKLPHKFPNNLRLRTLGNKETLGKFQIWVETWPSAQPPFQKLNFGNSIQKNMQKLISNFIVLSNFTRFLYLLQIFCPRLPDLTKLWSQLGPVCFKP